MKVISSLGRGWHKRNCSGLRLWTSLVCLLFLNVSAVSPQEPSQPRSEPAPQTQDKTACDESRKTAQRLSAEVAQLKRKVAELEKYTQVDSLRELLIKEEQRAQALQAQLRDTSDKEAAIQPRIDQVDYQMRPENIESALAGSGSVHPEDARELVRRRLNNEKRQLQTQLDLLHQNHGRLQGDLAAADASIQRLRLKIIEATRR